MSDVACINLDRTRVNVPKHAWTTIRAAALNRGYTTDQLLEDIARQIAS